MSFGLQIRNDNGNVIISDGVTSFYYYGPADFIDGTNDLEYGGVSVFIFDTYTSKPIVPFVRPRDLGFFAITRIFRGANDYWNVEVAVKGGNASKPELFIFTTAEAENWSTRFTRGDMDHGLRVKRADGSTAFDSAAGQPMAIRGAVSVIPPTEPLFLSTSLTPTEKNSYDMPSGITTPMFGYYSMAMSERQYTTTITSEECFGLRDPYSGNCLVGLTTVTVQTDLYWAFYRAGIQYDAALAKLNCGWLTYSSGHLTVTQTSDSFSTFIPIVDLGGGTGTSGTGPFVNETINLKSATVLILDKANYPASNYTAHVFQAKAVTNIAATPQRIDDNGEYWTSTVTWKRSRTAYGYRYFIQVIGRSDWIAVAAGGGLDDSQYAESFVIQAIEMAYNPVLPVRFRVYSLNQDTTLGNYAEVEIR